MPKTKKLKTIGSLKGVTSIKRLFSSPRRWTKGTMKSPDATAVCLLGAVKEIYPSRQGEIQDKIKKSISKYYKITCGQAKKPDIIAFNDARTRTFRDVKWVVSDANV